MGWPSRLCRGGHSISCVTCFHFLAGRIPRQETFSHLVELLMIVQASWDRDTRWRNIGAFGSERELMQALNCGGLRAHLQFPFYAYGLRILRVDRPTMRGPSTVCECAGLFDGGWPRQDIEVRIIFRWQETAPPAPAPRLQEKPPPEFVLAWLCRHWKTTPEYLAGASGQTGRTDRKWMAVRVMKHASGATIPAIVALLPGVKATTAQTQVASYYNRHAALVELVLWAWFDHVTCADPRKGK